MAEQMLAESDGQSRDLMTGTRLGPYRIERQIGRGGMGAVYEARHVLLDRVVALKLLLPSYASDQECVDRFLAEAREAARLDHPHIVPIYDCGEINGVNYIAMKLLAGRDLKRVLQEERQAGRGRLPLDRTIHLISQAAGAIAYAHDHRLVHRDVKPANIYVDENDWVTLVDFGIALALDYSSSTVTGTIIGTPTYMAPEQALGRRADNRSDIYSLGVVLYEMLSGVPPFSGDQQTVMYAHVHRAPAPLAATRPDIPAAVTGVVQRALAKSPDDRFQRADALAAALRQSATGRPTDQTAATVISPNEDETSKAPPAAPDVVGMLHTPPMQPSVQIAQGTAVRAEPTAATPARERSGRLGLPVSRSAVAALAVVAALLLWLLLSGRILAGDGRLTVDSDPAGATVTVDGNVLGTTPLSAQSLTDGPHEVVLEKPTYLQVKRREQIGRGETDALKTALPPAPAFDLLEVKTATVATGVSQDESGRILFAAETDSVAADEPFALILSVAQKQPGFRDIVFRCQVDLVSPSGTRLAASDPETITIPKDDAGEHSCAYKASLPATAAAGTYQAEFFIDGKEAAPSRPIAFSN